MALYDINFNYKAVELLPPDKRGLLHVTWVRVLLRQVQALRDKILGDYRTGSSYPLWISGGLYSKGQLAVFKQVVYESLEDSNTDSPPSSKWRFYLPSFISSLERLKYNGQKLILEYALNKRFAASFRQPPLVSDIYITTTNYVVVGFVVAKTETPTSSVGQTTSEEAVGYSYPFSHLSNFTINIPALVYAAISEQEVREFVDKIIPAGLNYTVVSY